MRGLHSSESHACGRSRAYKRTCHACAVTCSYTPVHARECESGERDGERARRPPTGYRAGPKGVTG
eukprot:4889653-Prymnesium_polylepis.1